MRIVHQQFETKQSELNVAKRLHPEDLSVGDDVVLSEVSFQYASFCWCAADTTMFPPERPVRVTFLPFGDLEPLQVKSVCLPFVLCKLADGIHKVYDVRQVQFMKLNRDFANGVREVVEDNKVGKKVKNKKRKKKRK